MAEPFHDSPEARHAAFQERKARLLEEARRGTGRKGRGTLAKARNAGLSSYSFDRTTEIFIVILYEQIVFISRCIRSKAGDQFFWPQR